MTSKKPTDSAPTGSPTSSGAAPSTLAPEALAGLGKLRECVAAARNLQHLVASREVGPKVLEQVVPDVATELEPFSQAIADIYQFVQGELNLPDNTLSTLVDSAQATTCRLVEALRAKSSSGFNAKRRLSVERNIRETLPPLSSTLSQIELLVEATANTGVPMSVGELLSSTPDVGSNRPHRTISVLGNVEGLIVTVPARIGLRCLGMLSASLESEGRPHHVLQALEHEGRHWLRFVDAKATDVLQADLPLYPHTAHSLDTMAAALGRFGGRLKTDRAGLTLPAA